jgi:beta-glucanase (GH16 family)
MKFKNKFNSTFKRLLFCAIALCTFFANSAKSQTLVWQDNFDSATINPNRWTYDFGDGCERNLCGWGNAELMYYTSRNENVRTENGNLVIEARRENYGTRSFTSARIKTEGRVHFKYGTVEARIKIPNLANGFWPAFWTLGTIGPSWPSIGELDIMEMGSQSARFANLINKQVSGATHWSNNNGSQGDAVGIINSSVDLNNDYHVFKMVWTAQSITMYLDNVVYFTQNITNPVANGLTEFHNPHFLILNLAVGGGYTGILNPADITATFPSKMYIDYVRIYQNPGDEINFGLDNSTSGNYGVFSETTPKTDSLTIGTNASLSYWNNLTNIAGAVPFEGNNVWAVRANAGNWFGLGVDNKYINLSTHTAGALKFKFKTSYQGQFKFGLKSSDGDAWVNFPNSSVQYGLIRDGNWHEVTIPLTAFNSPSTGNYIDYGAVKYAFMFTGDAPNTTADFYMDDIYFSKNTTTSPSPTLSSFSIPAKVLGDAPFAITAPVTNSGGAFFYSSSNTAVATISGNTITLVGAGTAIITATQSAFGNFGSASISANLVVTTPTLSTAAPTPPLRNASDVISLYSNAYTALAGMDLNPNWGQSTVNTDVVISGNNTRKMESFNYQGIQISGSVNVSTMNSLHIDVWTPNCTQFNLYLINTSPSVVQQKVTLTPTFLGWNSYDIALSDFNLINLSNVHQLKFDCLPFGSTILYFDNLYFWKTSNTPVLSNFSIPTKVLGDAPFTITPPTSNSNGAFTYSSSNTSVATISGNQITIVGVGNATITANQAASGIYSAGTTTANFVVGNPAPSAPLVSASQPPARNTADYLSIFSDAYTNLSGTDFFPNWNQSTTVTNVLIGSNNVKKYELFNYQGIQLASVINVNTMEKVHIDIWTTNCTAFDFYLVNTTPVLNEQKVTLTPTFSGWNSFDIALSNFNSVALNNITQFKFVGVPSGTAIVYWDNLYFWKTGQETITTPTISVTQPTCQLPSGSVYVTSSTAGLTFSINGVNYSNTNGVFTGLTPGSYSLTSKTASGIVSTAVSFTINPLTGLPQAVTSISGTRNINQCDTLQIYSVAESIGSTYNWSVTGTGNRIFSDQGTGVVTMVMKSAGIVSVTPTNSCVSGTVFSISVVKSVPPTPTVLTSTGTNICGFTQSAFALTGVKDTFRTNTISGATGYYFEAPVGSTVARLNDTTITVVFADNISFATPQIVNAYYLSSCDTSLAKSIALTRSVVAAPTAITITPIQTNVCGARKYRYSAPALPAGALGYVWSFVGNLYNNSGTIDSGTVNSRVLTVTYTSNAASAAGDSVKLLYTTGCGNSASKAAKLSNTALSIPAVPTAITITPLIINQCNNRVYRYSAPNLPAANTTAGAASGWLWELTGSMSEFATIDSGDEGSQKMVVSYASNDAAASGDSIKLTYLSGCGNSLTKAAKMTNTKLSAPAAPSAITITSIQTNVCGARRYRYVAPLLPSASATTGVATGYVWSIVGGLGTPTIDSGSLTTRGFIATFASNAAAATGDSVRVLYTSGCGNSLRKASKLSNTALGTPLAPATVTIQQILPDVCGARVYRYIAPATLPGATATAGAASGYLWTSPTGTVGSTFTLDSGSTSGRIIRYRYASNAAAGVGDSIRVRYTSGCGNGVNKAQKLSNLAKVCLTNGTEITSRTSISQNQTNSKFAIYPNPNKGQFKIRFEQPVSKTQKIAISLFDEKGNCIRKINNLINEGEIEKQFVVDNLSNGLYFINYIIGNQTGVERIIILR